MKTKSLLFFASVLFIVLISCNKENSNNDNEDIQTTFTLSENEAVGDFLSDDVNNVFFEVSIEQGVFRTGQATQTLNILSCASVTVDPPNTFPKTISIDFGAGCTANGITRSGKISIVLSDSVRKTGSTAVMSFDNYKVQGFKIEGTLTWTNTSAPGSISWEREIENGKITVPSGNYYWLHVGTKSVTQTAGANTPFNLLDDVFSVTGDHTVTNPQGKSRTATITEALEVKTTCSNVTRGKVKVQGPNHYAVIDYGDGTCDRVATISIDGHAPHNFLLP